MHPNASVGRRPRLTPARADVRRAVRESLTAVGAVAGDTVLVGLSGGADSLALAAATAFEGPRTGIRVGAVIVDHALQPGSSAVAERAAATARELSLHPVIVETLEPAPEAAGNGGPEARARAGRYAAFERARAAAGARFVLLGHTLDDQAEGVLLGLARGSGAASMQGMAQRTGPFLRPLLSIRRATTRRFCADEGLEPWDDPQNTDHSFARVRTRTVVLPTLEAELGPGIAGALARTADQLREDAEALDAMVEETIEDICEHAEAGISVSVGALEANPPALRNRIIRSVVAGEFGASLERVHVLQVARLVTDWHGQKPLDLPGVRVTRRGGQLTFTASQKNEREAG